MVACGLPARDIFLNVPGLSAIHVIEKSSWAKHWFKLWLAVIWYRWDAVVDLRRSAIAYFLLAKRRFILPKSDFNLHKVLDVSRIFGDTQLSPPTLWISDNDRKNALLRIVDIGTRPLVCVGPAANWGGKVWPAERFAELLKRLVAPGGILPGAKIAVFGALSERDQTQKLIDLLDGCNVVDLVGRVEILTCAAMFSMASMYIGNDSGLMHIAAASGGNVLGLFGPSQSRHYAPWPSRGGQTMVAQTALTYEQLVGNPSFDHRKQDSLMTSLTVDMAEAKARELWQNVMMRKVA